MEVQSSHFDETIPPKSNEDIAQFLITPKFDPNNLPAAEYFNKGLYGRLQRSRVIEIKAPTGTGKTLAMAWRLPVIAKAALEHKGEILIAQPTRATCLNASAILAEAASQKVGQDFGHSISRDHKPGKKITLVTYGLLLRKILSEGIKDQPYVLDESHDISKHAEVAFVMTFFREALYDRERYPNLRLIIMSATPHPAIAKMFGGKTFSQFDIPVEGYPKIPGTVLGTMVQSIAQFVSIGINTLAFDSGKKELSFTASELKKLNIEYDGVPLQVSTYHGDLPKRIQSEILKNYQSFDVATPSAIIATNALENGVTLKGIRAVVTSGWKREASVTENGVEQIRFVLLSQDEIDQQFGRGSRFGSAMVVDQSKIPYASRIPHPKSAIEIEDLSSIYLALICAGRNPVEFIQKLPFKVPHSSLQRDLKFLEIHSLVTRSKNLSFTATSLGKEVNKYGLDVRGGLLIALAEQAEQQSRHYHGLKADTLLMGAIISAKGILLSANQSWRDLKNTEYKSDLYAQVLIYKQVQILLSHCNTQEDRELIFEKYGIDESAFEKVELSFREIVDRFNLKTRSIDEDQPQSYRSMLNHCIAVGFKDWIFVTGGGDNESKVQGKVTLSSKREPGITRRLPETSKLLPKSGDYILGIPMDIEYRDEVGEIKTAQILQFASIIDRRVFDQVNIKPAANTTAPEPLPERIYYPKPAHKYLKSKKDSKRGGKR